MRLLPTLKSITRKLHYFANFAMGKRFGCETHVTSLAGATCGEYFLGSKLATGDTQNRNVESQIQ